MKILIVTSEVTFVPKNYNLFLEALFKDLKENHDINLSLIVLKNNSFTLFLKAFGLIFIGAKSIGFNLFSNSLNAHIKDHQKIAQKYNIPTYYFKNPNDPKFIDFVSSNQVDLIVNARTRFIYKKKILKTPKLGCLNIHHGILPKFRGTMCDLYALYEGRPAGFSIHKMESKIDTGAIVRLKEVTIPNKNNPDSMNFSKHIEDSSWAEGIELSQLLKIIKEMKEIPIEKQNIETNPIYTKNPDRLLIRKMKRMGLKL